MDARINFSWSVGIVVLGIIGVGFGYSNGIFKGYLKGKNGPVSVKKETCLNVNEIIKLNVKNALGCPDGKGTETKRELALPAAPLTLSAATNGENETIQIKATRKHSLGKGIDAEASLTVEVWNNKPEQRKPTASPNWPLYQQPIPWGAKSGKATVLNESLSPKTVAGARAFTPISDADVPSAPADVYIRIADAYSSILERNNRPFSGIAGTTTR